MEKLRPYLEPYLDPSLSDSKKIEKLKVLRDILTKLERTGDVIEEVETGENLIKFFFEKVASDLNGTNRSLRREALSTLDLMYQCKWESVNLPEALIVDVSTKDNEELGVALGIIRSMIKDFIVNNKCNPEEVLTNFKTDAAVNKIAKIMEEACMDIPVKEGLIFFYEEVIPCMFSTDNLLIRVALQQLAFSCLPRFPISLLNEKQSEEFKLAIQQKYTEKIKNLIKVPDSSWQKLWIFLVKCLSHTLLSKSGCLNCLLKVLEDPFRRNELETVRACFACWKVFIDTSAYYPDLMCKRAKLMTIPIKAGSRKMVQLTNLKLDVWLHLLNALKEKSFDCYLPMFLQFCFGPLSETPLHNYKYSNEFIVSDADFWNKSIGALFCILGHYGHTDKNSCLKSVGDKKTLDISAPIINHTNFILIDYIIINAVGECCFKMMNFINENDRTEVVKCLWGSLFNIIRQLDQHRTSEQDKVPIQDKALQRITSLLAVYVEISSKEDSIYGKYVLEPVFELLIENKLFDINILKFSTQLLFPIVKEVLKHNSAQLASTKTTISKLLLISKTTSNKDIWFKKVFDTIYTVEVTDANIKEVLTLWKDCADVFNDICKSPSGLTENIVQSTVLEFMVWPVSHMNKVPSEEHDNITNEFTAKWGKMFTKLFETYERNSLVILEKLRNNVKTSPQIASSIAELFPNFHEIISGTASLNSDFLSSLLNLISQLLSEQPSLETVTVLVVPTLTLILQNSTQDNAKINLKTSDMKLLCQCFEYLLLPHKECSYLLLTDLLQSMETFFKKITTNFKNNIPASLLEAIKNFQINNQNEALSKAANDVLSSLNSGTLKNKPKPNDLLFTQPRVIKSSRATKIANMAMKSTSPKKNSNSPGQATVLQLFGYQTIPAVQIRGSQLKNDSVKGIKRNLKKRKLADISETNEKMVPIDEDETANYALIDQQYKFDATKLTEHQLEVIKKRRFDIPALYQDLSQSQSNSESIVKKTLSCTAEGFLGDQNNTSSPNLLNVENQEKDNFIGNEKASNAISEDLFPSESLTFSNVISTLINKDKFTKPVGNEVREESDKVLSDFSEKDKTNKLEQKSKTMASKVNKSKPRSSTKEDNLSKLPTGEICTQEDNTVSENIINDDRVDLKIQNPSKNKIEALINENSSSPLKKRDDVNSKAEEVSENVNSSMTLTDLINNYAQDKKRLKVINEMKKLKMDIVGGDRFLDSIDAARKTRTRSRDSTSTATKSGSNAKNLNNANENPKTRRGRPRTKSLNMSFDSPVMKSVIEMNTDNSLLPNKKAQSENNNSDKFDKCNKSLTNETISGLPKKSEEKKTYQIKAAERDKTVTKTSNEHNNEGVRLNQNTITALEKETMQKTAIVSKEVGQVNSVTTEETDLSNNQLQVNKEKSIQRKFIKRRNSVGGYKTGIDRIQQSRNNMTEIDKAKQINNEGNHVIKDKSDNKKQVRRKSDAYLEAENDDFIKELENLKNAVTENVYPVINSSLRDQQEDSTDKINCKKIKPSEIDMSKLELSNKKPTSVDILSKGINRLEKTVDQPEDINRSNRRVTPCKRKLGDTHQNHDGSIDSTKKPKAFETDSNIVDCLPNEEKMSFNIFSTGSTAPKFSKRMSKVRKSLNKMMETDGERDNELKGLNVDPYKEVTNSDLSIVPIIQPLPESEDIIESSQESFVEPAFTVTPVTPSKEDVNKIGQEEKEKTINLEMLPVVDKSRTDNMQNTNSEPSISNVSMCSPDELIEMDLVRSRVQTDINDLDTLTLEVDEELEEELLGLNQNNSRNDTVSISTLPVASDPPTRANELLGINRNTLRNDTVSIPTSSVAPDTPTRTNELLAINRNNLRNDAVSIPTSSLAADTPTRINELLGINQNNSRNDTVAIPTSPLAPDTETRTDEFLSNTINISPIKSVLGSETNSSKMLRLTETEKSPSMPTSHKKTRGKMIIAMVPHTSSQPHTSSPPPPPPHTPPPQPKPTYKIRRMDNIGNSSSSSSSIFQQNSRVHKMMKYLDPNIIEIDDDDDDEAPLPVLEFSRELPSPMATPKGGGILKRRNEDDGSEGFSPPRKKRVNFSDPTTTCEKIYFKVKQERDPDENLPSRENQPPTNPVVNHGAIYQPVFQEVEIRTADDDEIESPETQGSLENVNMMVDHSNPIVPELVDCTENIQKILKSTTAAVFMIPLQKQLEKKKVSTIGDLAKLSEAEVRRLPFKTPKIKVVRDVLLQFYEKYKNDRVKASLKKSSQKNSEIKVVTEKMLARDENEGLSESSTESESSNETDFLAPSSPSKNASVGNFSNSNATLSSSPTNNEDSASTGDFALQQAQPSEISRPESSQENCMTRHDRVCNEVVDPQTTTDDSKAWQVENIEEFMQMLHSVKDKILPLRTLCKIALEMFGFENFVSILKENKVLKFDDLVIDDNGDWNMIIKKTVDHLGLDKIMILLIAYMELTPSEMFIKIYDALQDCYKDDDGLQEIECHFLKRVPLTNILRNYDVNPVLDALYEMHEINKQSVADFFKYATFKFSPSIHEMAPSFRYINVIQLDFTKMTEESRKILNTFVNKVSSGLHRSIVNVSEVRDIMRNIPLKEKETFISAAIDELPVKSQESLASLVVNKIPINCQKRIVTEVVDKMWETDPEAATDILMNNPSCGQQTVVLDLVKRLPLTGQDTLTDSMFNNSTIDKQIELAWSAFDKLSNADAFAHISNYFNQRLQKKNID